MSRWWKHGREKIYNIDLYKNDLSYPSAKIEQLSVKRDWMHPSVYNCTPLTTANRVGYGIYFEKDISFVWDGDEDSPAQGILGKEYVWPGRGAGTVSFNTNFILRTDEKTSILTTQIPNQKIDGAMIVSNLISTSFFTSDFPVVWKLDIPNKEYFVPAGTYVACIIPISMSELQDSNIKVHEEGFPFEKIHGQGEYIKALKDAQKTHKFLKLYQKGIDHLGKKVGNHEVRNLNLNVSYPNGTSA